MTSTILQTNPPRDPLINFNRLSWIPYPPPQSLIMPHNLVLRNKEVSKFYLGAFQVEMGLGGC